MSSDDEIELSHKMNHCVVPEFQMDDNDYPSIPSIFTPLRKSTSTDREILGGSMMLRGDEEIMELVWQNGQIIMQSQNQRCMKKYHLFAEQSAVEETVAASAPLFMQQDEMTSLLQSPLDDSSSFADFLYTTPTSAAMPGEIDTTTSCTAVSTAALAGEIDKIDTSTAEIRPDQPYVETIASSSSRLIIPQLKCTEGELTHRLQNYLYTRPNCAAVTSAAAQAGEIDKIGTSTAEICSPYDVGTIASPYPWPIIPQLRPTEGESIGHFSRLPEEAILRNYSVRPSTVVESNETVIAAVPEYIVSRRSDNVTPVSAAAAAGGVSEVMTPCELRLTPSKSGSAGSVGASAEPQHPSWKAARAAAAKEEDRKRKGGESDDNEGQSEDVEFESVDAKKQVRNSTSAKKSRAAEVHNLSERRRRDRINEKMRVLQELIPHCNKSDKASKLDKAIEYLKSLQLQVQMMSTGCSMVPMMYPGIPQHMPTMGMNMGMGMSMEMGMNRPMVPYLPLMPGPAMRNAAVAAQMAPRYPLPACHLPSRIPAANQPDPPRLNSLVGHNINQPRLPYFNDPYHQYFGLQQAQLLLPQSQRAEQPSSSKPNSCVEGSAGNHQSG